MQKYQILSAIGEGAYGVVLKCRDIEAKMHVAIKKFKETDQQEHTKKTTMRQVKILKMATHTNIVGLKQAFRKKGIVYLVFEYVQNNLLEVLQKSHNGLRMPVIRTLIYQLLKGLVYLHDLNIVHRDIKPENLLVSKDNKLKICDFGFARQLREKEEGLTDYVATRWYRPAELLVGGTYGKEIDIWAVGCIMCEIIDGNPLFPGQNELDQLFLIQKTFGALPPELQQRFLKNQRYLGMKFPQIHNFDKLQKKYFGKVCQKGLSLIKGLLKVDPSERLTALEALEHPFFDAQRQGEGTMENTDRMETYTTATNRKKQSELSVGSVLAERTKYGKIYNKRGKNFQAVAQVYQSSNNCKLNLGSKSLGKQQQKKNTYNQEMSLQKHRNKDVLMKTQARGFYFDTGEEKLSAYGDNSKKSTEMGSIPSHQQLPFLLYSQQASGDDTFRKYHQTTTNPKQTAEPKRKPQMLAHRQTFNIKQLTANR